MLYAINERKEHRVHAPGEPYSLDECIVQADADDWIPWEGGECPLPDGSLHEVQWKDGVASRDDEPETWNWRCESDPIIAYRPILDDKEQDMSEQEWNGEGLPPVGVECEHIDMLGGRYRVLIVGRDIAIGRAIFRSMDFSDLEYESGLAGDFRPIRTAAQKAEDEAVGAMWAAWERGDRKGGRPQTMREIYTAIREGCIPGVKLED